MWKTQFGFRKKHSTAEALFISRRIQDYVETSGDKAFLIFLDWEKAFDKIDQEGLFEAMERMNIDPKLIRLTKQLYKKADFFVEMDNMKSKWKTQKI